MIAQEIIDAMKKSDSLKSIATCAGIDKLDLKAKLIELIEMNSDLFETYQETKSEKDSSEDDLFETIIKSSGISFTEEQIQFMNLAANHRINLALLSSAGYGKSAVIKTIVDLFTQLVKPYPEEWFKKRYGLMCNVEMYQSLPVIGLCASTGKAASLIKGKTIHSYLGIGMGRGSVDDWVKRVSTIKQLRHVYHTLQAVQTLIIDEISMVSAKLLDDISEYLKKIRKDKTPFGGIQMIFVGDFAQLPPVSGAFAFTSKEYIAANIKTFQFTKCFRQTDPVFLRILNNLRNGECSDEDFQILKNCKSIDESISRGMRPMRLLSTNVEVDNINLQELEKTCQENNTEIVSFKIKPVSDPKKSEACRKAEMIPEEVQITIGAQVIVTYNLPNGAVNGTQGRVISIAQNEVVIESHDAEIYKIPYIPYKDPDQQDQFNADVLFYYMPLRLGWACTIHKSQGCTFALLEVDLKRSFAHGQAYVALSRAKSLKSLVIKNLSKKAIVCDPKVKQFMNTL